MPMNEILQLLLTQEQASPSGGGMWDLIIQVGLILMIFYFLLIRPQQKRTKQHQTMLGALKRDDDVVTSGGIFGKITGITDTVVTLEIAPNVRIKVQRSQVAGLKATESGKEAK